MKKKINIKIVAILILTVLVSGACNKWMDLEPEDKLIRQEFWQKEDDVNAAVAAMYDAFRGTSLKSLMMGEVRADMVYFRGSDFGDYTRIAASDITPTMWAVRWDTYYFTINLANTIMQFMPDVVERDNEFTEEERMKLHGEALFIRSLTYFYLVRLWKDVPFVESASSSDTVDFYYPKSTEQEVLVRVLDDLKYAETIAPSGNMGNPALFKGRANKHSIRALIADIYLWMEKYDDCIEYCDKIISSGLYSLESETDWFKLYYPGNSNESIFEIQYNELYNEPNPIYDKLIQLNGQRQVQPKPIINELFTPLDIRRCGNNNIIWKYLGKSLETPLRRGTGEADANFIYYRYADIMLMKAEALAELGRFNESQELLLDIIYRSGQIPAFSPSSLEEFRELILNERAREFALEGKRWFDILRFAKKDNFANKSIIIDMILENTTVQDRPILRSKILDTMSYYLPIPESDLLYNEQLVQNPYYDR